MSKRAQYEIPAGLKEAEQRFAEWRSSHSGRRPIPEPLWALAAELASEHGVFRTAQVLRLNYSKLKQRTLAAAPAEPGSRRSRRRARSVPSRQSGRRAAPPAGLGASQSGMLASLEQ